jgi:protein-disulfide isomerase
MANRTRARAQLQAQRVAAAKKARRRRIITAVVCTAIVAAAAGFIVFWLNRQGADTTGEPVTPPNASAGQAGIVTNPAVTSPEHSLVIYGDYQCSACYNYETALAPVLREAYASSTVSLEFRNRDFLDGASGHGNFSRLASIASACADTVGSFFSYHLGLYEQYGELSGESTDEALRETIPANIGLEGTALATFQSCYDNRSTAAFVDAMDAAASAAGVNSTPTFLVDGQDFDQTAWLTDDGSDIDLNKVRTSLGLPTE